MRFNAPSVPGPLILKPVTEEFYRKLRGSLEGKRALKALVADRALEKEK